MTNLENGTRDLKAMLKSYENLGLGMLKDRVLIKELKDMEEKVVAGGIIIPKSNDQKSRTKTGLIIKRGPFAKTVKVGQIAYFSFGETIDFKGEEFFVLRDHDIIATM